MTGRTSCHRQTQTYKQMSKQTDRHTNQHRQTMAEPRRQTQTDMPTGHMDTHSHRQIDTQNRQSRRHNRKIDRQNRHSRKHSQSRHRQTHIDRNNQSQTKSSQTDTYKKSQTDRDGDRHMSRLSKHNKAPAMNSVHITAFQSLHHNMQHTDSSPYLCRT